MNSAAASPSSGVESELQWKRKQQSVRKKNEETESTEEDRRDDNEVDRVREEKRGRGRT